MELLESLKFRFDSLFKTSKAAKYGTGGRIGPRQPRSGRRMAGGEGSSSCGGVFDVLRRERLVCGFITGGSDGGLLGSSKAVHLEWVG